MSLPLVKAILAAILLAAAGTAAFTMFTVLGRTDVSGNPEKLKRLHKTIGFTILGLLLALSVAGVILLRAAGDRLPLRVVLHYHLVLVFWAVILLKIAIVSRFRGLLRLAPALGMTMFVLSFVIVSAAAGTYVLWSGRPTAAPAPIAAAAGEAARGERLFQVRCASCHYADREETKTGPGLKGILKKAALPVSGRPATVEGVTGQLRRPYRMMPAFPDLGGGDLADLIAYLQTL